MPAARLTCCENSIPGETPFCENGRETVVEVVMRIAIPIFGTRISPRFDCALSFGMFDAEGKRIIESRTISCEGWRDIERVSKLKDLGVDALICGGLPNHLLGILTNSGIKVVPWIAGNVDEALALFLQNRLDPGMILCPGRGQGRRCRRGIKSRE
jgi:predicted Fe-Mo cluster-binding NifX family protein